MAISDEGRHHLYRRLEEVLGEPEAATMMAHLPPVGWAEVATKRDLDALEERMDLRFAGLEERMDLRFGAVDQQFAGLEARMDHRFAAVDQRFAGLDLRFDGMDRTLVDLRADFRTWTIAILTAMVILVGGMITAIKI